MDGSWSELNEARRAVRQRWPSIWSLRRIARATRYAAARVQPGETVLDVGGSGGALGAKLPPGVDYRTLDVDPALSPDYRTLDEVEPASCHAVFCFEMIEHVAFEDAKSVVAGIARALRPGGRLYLSTPNIFHPWSYLRSATHVTPFCFDELGALLALSGLEVEAFFRCHHDAWLKGGLRALALPLYRIVGVDYAKSILAVARRPAESTGPKK